MQSQTKYRSFQLASLLMILACMALATPASAQVTTAITYQGKLFNNGAPLNGTADIIITLWSQSASGTQFGPGCAFNGVTVSDGLVNLTCDFGSDSYKDTDPAIPPDRWLQIDVRTPAGAGAFTPLTPRQQLTPAPLAIQAKQLELPYVDQRDNPDESLVNIHNTAITGAATALRGLTDGPLGSAVVGEALASTGDARGVAGYSDSNQGLGVYGEATTALGVTFGVVGMAASANGTGVYGHATDVSDELFALPRGGWFQADGDNGVGVEGEATAITGNGVGGDFSSESVDGVGVRGTAKAFTGNTRGVVGVTYGDFGAIGVEGVVANLFAANSIAGKFLNEGGADGFGVVGEVTFGGDVVSVGVQGITNSQSAQAAGVVGEANSPLGDPTGVYGESSGGYGVWGYHSGAGGARQVGVYGQSEGTGGSGVMGEATRSSGITFGVLGVSNSSIGTGIRGEATRTDGRTTGGSFLSQGDVDGSLGVLAEVTGETAEVVAIEGRAVALNENPNTYAGKFLGPVLMDASSFMQPYALEVRGDTRVTGGSLTVTDETQLQGNVTVGGSLFVTGVISKGGGTFKIDHPLDPENQYLSHSFVESPDMMNIYNGNIVTDDDGYATVTMPDWFEALNRDFRYQLTIIDDTDSADFVLAKVVQRIEGNAFRIRTNVPHAEVSWQVTGVRQDPYANHNRVQVETDKAHEHRGRYLHPKAYGVDASRRIHAIDRSH